MLLGSFQGGNNGLQDFKTSKDFERLQKTPRDFNNRDFKFLKDFQKTSKNFIRLFETP
jgi:hypothetical protein